MKNTLPVTPAVRNPRGLVKINSTIIPGWISLEVVNNAFFQADTFSAQFAVSMLPTEFGPKWWSNTEKMEVELFAGFPSDPTNFSPSDLDSIFFGVGDEPEWGVQDRKITLTGRDLTARFLDTKSDEKYPNLTASQIAAKLAGAQGLTPVVTATTTKAGRYYASDNVLMQDNRTQWDLLCYLARQENFTVYVKGKELHFEPLPALNGDPYVFQYIPPDKEGGPAKGNFERMSCSRALTLAKDIIVKVRVPVGPLSKRAIIRTAKVSRKGSSGDSQTYVYEYPGLKPDQAQQRAQQLAEELSRHERKASIEGPADNLLQRTDVVKIEGTDTGWDQIYFVDSIRRTLDTSGYNWSVGMKNHSPETQVTV